MRLWSEETLQTGQERIRAVLLALGLQREEAEYNGPSQRLLTCLRVQLAPGVGQMKFDSRSGDPKFFGNPIVAQAEGKPGQALPFAWTQLRPSALRLDKRENSLIDGMRG